MPALSNMRNYIYIIVSFLLIFGGIELPFGIGSDIIKADEAIRIMSFNIRCTEFTSRSNIVPQVISDYKADSVGLQECTYDWVRTLKNRLDEYTLIGVGRDTGDLSLFSGESSAILYRTEKYDLIDSGTFWLSETPDKVSFGWDAAYRRICTWVILKDKATGQKYAHINTHLDNKGLQASKNGTQMVADFAKNFDMPVVVTGDFNYTRENSNYNIMINSGLSDTQDLAEITMKGKTYHGYEGGTEGLPIDFIFVNDKITDVSKYRIITRKYNNKYTSDHYPIYADIKF